LRDFSLRDFGASLNTVESYTNEISQGKIGLCETANKQKCTHLGMFLASDKNEICTTRHSYKTCPLYIIPQWDKFLELVVKYYSGAKSKKENNQNTTNTSTTFSLPYKVKVKIDSLNVRADAGVNNKITCTIKKNEVYTIIEEKKVKNSDGSIATWGRLKSKIGWLNVGDKYVTKIK